MESPTKLKNGTLSFFAAEESSTNDENESAIFSYTYDLKTQFIDQRIDEFRKISNLNIITQLRETEPEVVWTIEGVYLNRRLGGRHLNASC